jgi:hypothetical protein
MISGQEGRSGSDMGEAPEPAKGRCAAKGTAAVTVRSSSNKGGGRATFPSELSEIPFQVASTEMSHKKPLAVADLVFEKHVFSEHQWGLRAP